MQALTASPREGLTAAQVVGLLTAPAIEVTAGCELLNTSNVVVADISDDLLGGEVRRVNYADVHGACRLRLTRKLRWGVDRVRPYMVLTQRHPALGVVEGRFNLGVYVLSTPSSPRGTTPATYEADGLDLLALLQATGPGDTYVVNSGTSYLTAVQSAITASGVGATVMLDGTGGSLTLPQTMVWALTPTPATWLRIVNDLLLSIGYRGLWADQDGRLRSQPYLVPASRPVEWTFDTADLSTNLVGEQRVEVEDLWRAPNWWRFVQTNMTAKPVEGAGLYTVSNTNDGVSSQATLGRTVRKVLFLEAADQASLVAQGDKVVAEDKAVIRTYELDVDPLPIAGHFDVVQLRDGERDDKCQVMEWALPLDGAPGRWKLEVVQGGG